MSDAHPDTIYSKPEVLLGDLRGGVCSSGLCKQLRSVAADEIEQLTQQVADLQAARRARLEEIGRLTKDRDYWRNAQGALCRVESELRICIGMMLDAGFQPDKTLQRVLYAYDLWPRQSRSAPETFPKCDECGWFNGLHNAGCSHQNDGRENAETR